MSTPVKPQRVPVVPEQIPDDLKAAAQWIVWEWVWREPDGPRPGKWDKPPLTVLGELASSTDSTTWSAFDRALAAYRMLKLDGIGRVVTADEGLVGWDFDHCVQPDGTIAPRVWDFLARLNSYTERTPSGTGLRVWVRGTLPPDGRKKGDVEVYNDGRYFTVTGARLPDFPATIEARPAEIAALHAQVWGEKKTRTSSTNGQPRGPIDLDDAALLELARGAKNGDKFTALWAGDWSRFHPSQSEADFALCEMLTFWCGRNAARVDALFRRSGLLREKWDEPHYSGGETYGQHAVAKAIRLCAEVYTPRPSSRRRDPGPDHPGPDHPGHDEHAGDEQGGDHAGGDPHAEDPDPGAWPTPAPAPAGLLPVPRFDAARLLPPVLAAWVADVAERAQCPPDFVAVGVLVAAAAVVGRQLTIRPKVHDDWAVVPNLWGLAVGRPGLMKTAAMQEAQRGLRRLIADAREAYQRALKQHEFDVLQAKARRAAIEKQIKAAAERGESTESLREAFEAATIPEPPTERRYIVNDTTVEKLGELLNANPNGLLLFRDELMGFLRTMDREGHQNDRAFYCEAWNGTGTYTYDRIARGTLYIEAACVSILGGIQPAPLAHYLRETFAHGQDDGLIQRHQLLVYPDVALGWQNVDHWPDTEARQRLVACFQALDQLDLPALGAHTEAGALAFLRFTPEAQARFDAWRQSLEQRLRTTDEHPILLSHFAKFRSLAPSLALLFHLIHCVDRGHGGPVSESALDQALAWCAFLEPHARRVYQQVTNTPEVAAAALATKIQAGLVPSPFRARPIRLKGWTSLSSPEEMDAAIEWLQDLGWLRRVERPSTVRGGRPTVEYEIHPVLRRAP